MFAARSQFFAQPAGGGFGNNAFFPGNGSQFLSKAGTTNLVTWKATTGYTVEYWGYWTSFGASIQGGPGNQDGGGTNYNSFGPCISGGASGTLEFYYWGPGTQFLTTAGSIVPLNTWTNIAAVFTTSGSNTTASLYVNGIRRQIRWNNTGSYADTQTVNNGAVSAGTVYGMGKYGGSIVNGFYNNLRVSNINRYSGASYTLATADFVSDSNTQLLIVPTGAAGTTIPYQSTAGNGNMTNASNLVTNTVTRANHT
jgi:hypothetical protein